MAEKSASRGDDPEVSAAAAAATAADRPGSDEPTETDLDGDWSNALLLTLLYAMQSLPLGMGMAVPVFLKSKPGSTYREQALFSLAFWPFSMKLLWAPVVDSLYIQKLGRRKSWLVPVQYSIGAILICSANSFDYMLSKTEKSDVQMMMYVFFTICFLAATQDIAVDGWALTMLKKNNVGYASTCNSIGQAIGGTLGYSIFVLLTSENFCNNYLRNEPAVGGLVTIRTMFYCCGALFFCVTTLVAVCKKEKDTTLEDDHVKLDVIQTYSLLWDVLKLRSVQLLGMALLTSKIGFAAADSVTTLKLIDAGVSKEDITIISTAMSGVNIVVPIIAGKYISGPKSIIVYLNTVPFRLLLNVPFVLLIYYFPKLKSPDGVANIPLYYYAIVVLLLSVQHILMYTMFISIMAFFSRISDPRFGGTYMTLLNTIANIGLSWTSTAALRIIDVLTVTKCSSDSSNNCATQDLKNTCIAKEGDCITTVDGYYVEMILCTIIGIVWYVIFGKILKNLQKKSPSQWLVDVKKNQVTDIDNSSFPM